MSSDEAMIDAAQEKAASSLATEYLELSEAKLERMREDRSLPDVEREAADRALAEKRAQRLEAENLARQKVGEFETAVAARKAARQQARETASDDPEPKQAKAATDKRRGADGMSPNNAAAEQFAAILRRRGINALARPTKRIQGREVLDGWMVNARDEKHEVGVVAAWWGRAHFTCFFEIAGHSDRTEESAELMGVMLNSLDAGGLELVDQTELDELRRSKCEEG